MSEPLEPGAAELPRGLLGLRRALLFVLAGNLMNASGITERIFDFARAVFGPIRGGGSRR